MDTQFQKVWPSLYGADGVQHAGLIPHQDLYEKLQPPKHASARACEDAKAAWCRWADISFLESRKAQSEMSSLTSAVIERSRCEVLSMHHLPGMALNLADPSGLAPSIDFLQPLYLYSRSLIEAKSQEDTVSALHEAVIVHQWFDDWVQEILEMSPAAVQHFEDSQIDGPSMGLDGLSETDTATGAVDVGSDLIQDAELGFDELSADCQSVERQATASNQGASEKSAVAYAYSDYSVFSRSLDQEIKASAFLKKTRPAEKASPLLDNKSLATALRRLHRGIRSADRWQWQFDLPQGQLDPRRLSKLISTQPPFHIFRSRAKDPKGIAVCLLVDQSGSMKGRAQELAVMSVKVIAQQLERVGIPFEVLSFTTRFGGKEQAENPLFQRWRKQGRPSNPGRLNALRHIMIKEFHESWHSTERYLDILLDPSLGKENIDGEAVHWAASRLSKRSETNQLLIVLSDACPKDPSTDGVNPPLFLESHLRAVIREIERSSMTLVGLGMGQGSTHFYPIAESIDSIEELPEKVLNSVARLFESMRAPKAHRTASR